MTSNAPSKRDQIIDAAIEAFLLHGPRHISMEDIAEVAGMSRPALYQIFKNRQDLFRAVVEHVQDDLQNGVEAALASDAPLATRLGNAMVSREGGLFRLLHTSAHAKALDEAHMNSASDITERGEAAYQALLAASMVSAGIASTVAALTANYLSATAHGLKRRATDPDSFDEALRGAAALMAMAILPKV